ncbi:MAG: ABC transporter permease [Chloroflexi bacterium]|nr:ABC transporter permease [Chloroflexota bacterium]
MTDAVRIIAKRVITQIRRDRRTLAMILVVPVVVMTLIGLSFPDVKVLDYIAPALLGALAFFFGFLLTGISFLRERSQGTMERLTVSPVTRLDIVVGYLLGFFVFALVQTLIILLYTIYVFDITYHGQLWEILAFQVVVIIGAVNLGIFISSFARNEFQMVQFIPLVILPQMFLGGILWPVEQMPDYLRWFAHVLPLTYAVDGMREIMLNGKNLLDVWTNLAVLAGFAVLTSTLAAVTLRKGPGG